MYVRFCRQVFPGRPEPFQKNKTLGGNFLLRQGFCFEQHKDGLVLVFHCLLFPVHDAERPLGQCEKFILSGIYGEGRDKACPFF